MSFIADKQTLEDLNLPGKFKQDSVFRLFNRVQTRGAENLLQDMFKNPLSSPQEINRRSLIFNYFQDKGLVFPFTGGQLDKMGDYLSGKCGINYVFSYASLLRKKILGAVIKDEKYNLIVSGFQHTVKVLNASKEFLNRFGHDRDNPFYDEIKAAKEILKDERLSWLDGGAGRQQWSLFELSRYDHLLKQLLSEELSRLTGMLFQLDLYIAVGDLAREKGFSYAYALPKADHVLSATALRHPCIEKAVGNAVSFHQDNNLIFLTGANMAGKSTFMKSFGINFYLAHMGFPVAAKDMVFSIKDGLYSSINVPDNLDQGYSHFYAEVLRVKTVAEQVSSGKDLVVIFDELFKGTNVKDAYDATLAVTAAFSEYRNCFFIISTHIIEVGEALQQSYKNIQFWYMPTHMKGTVPLYTYQAAQGISNDRHGMVIIENEGILEMLLRQP